MAAVVASPRPAHHITAARRPPFVFDSVSLRGWESLSRRRGTRNPCGEKIPRLKANEINGRAAETVETDTVDSSLYVQYAVTILEYGHNTLVLFSTMVTF